MAIAVALAAAIFGFAFVGATPAGVALVGCCLWRRFGRPANLDDEGVAQCHRGRHFAVYGDFQHRHCAWIIRWWACSRSLWTSLQYTAGGESPRYRPIFLAGDPVMLFAIRRNDEGGFRVGVGDVNEVITRLPNPRSA